MKERLKFNKLWEIILVSFLAGVVVSGIAVGTFFYFDGDAVENNGTYLLNQKKSAVDVTTTLKDAEQDLKDAEDLDTTEVDGALRDLDSIDLSGV